MTDQRHHDHSDFSFAAAIPIHTVTLRHAGMKTVVAADLIKQEVLPLPQSAWVAFQGDVLGEPSAYAADLMRRLLPLRRLWIAPVSLAFVQRPGLVELAGQSGCRALLLDGGEISQAYLTTEAPCTGTRSVSLLRTSTAY